MGNIENELGSLALALVRQLQVDPNQVPSFVCECDEYFLELLPFLHELRKKTPRQTTPITPI